MGRCKIIHNAIMCREYKEYCCNITVWSPCRWDNAAVLFPKEIFLWRSWSRLFWFVSNVTGKELFGKLLCFCRKDMHRAGCHTWSIKQLVWQVRCCTKLLEYHLVLTLCVFLFPTITACRWDCTSFRTEAEVFTSTFTEAEDHQHMTTITHGQKPSNEEIGPGSIYPPYLKHTLLVSTRLLVQKKTKSHENLMVF